MTRDFRLSGLLRLRRLQEEQAAAALSEANSRTAHAHEEHQAFRAVMSSTLFPTHGDPNEWRAAVADRAAMSAIVGEAAIAVQVTARRAEIAAAEWTAARTTVATLDKLADRHEVLVRAEDERAEQLVLDEAASRRHQENS
ncbi:flagellar FliJ family protein [Actinotalea sp.]|uniref:flagellar FliJ family protein n=1 Tax=Actinotalea sp. TaxID=1872145 RepID=UPI00356957F3